MVAEGHRTPEEGEAYASCRAGGAGLMRAPAWMGEGLSAVLTAVAPQWVAGRRLTR